MAIISISRQKGSLGSTIGQALKKDLGYAYLDKETLEQHLISKYGFSEKDFDRYDERKPTFWEGFIGGKERYFQLLKASVYDFAQQGNCIIIGRGGQVLFRDFPGVLRVSVVAPMDIRIERVSERFSGDRRMAEHIVRDSDHDRAGFHHFFFDVNWEDHHLYDLVINTRYLTVEKGVQLIKDALQAFGTADQQADTENRLRDLCISQQVAIAVCQDENIPIQNVQVTSDNGIVTLKGSVMVAEHIKRGEEAARKVPGVKVVINELYERPTMYN